MKIISNAAGKSTIVKLPIDSAGTTMPAGTLLTMGVTANANMGAFILSGAAALDAVGILLNEFTNAADAGLDTGLIQVSPNVTLSGGDIVGLAVTAAPKFPGYAKDLSFTIAVQR